MRSTAPARTFAVLMSVFMLLMALSVLVPVFGHAQTAPCPTQLTDARLEVQLTDSQRARAVKDLAVANRLLNEQEAAIKRLQAELAKLKTDKAEAPKTDEAK